MDRKEEAYTLLVQLHETVDQIVEPYLSLHAERLQCKRGCFACCVDDLTVFEIEAARIQAAYPELLEEGTPRAKGMCAFLDEEGACRIYDARPYVCRTQGLPLRWLEEEMGEVVEYRDICPLNVVEDEPLEVLPGEACWPIGPVEEKLATFQAAYGDGQMTRVPLRSLFACDTP